MRQTAIEWLLEQLTIADFEGQQIAIKQAKKMEKQQIIDAYETSHISMMTSKQYYDETYNK